MRDCGRQHAARPARAPGDRTNYSLDDVSRLNAKCRAREATLAKSLVFAGTTWPGIIAWDDMRTVDYLASRPDALFPLAGMEEAVRTLSAVYAKAGVTDRFTGRFYNVPHIFNRQMQDDAFAWFDERLKG
jgi:hypothetical protein